MRTIHAPIMMFTALAAVILSSCSSVYTFNLSVLKPAKIEIQPEIKKVIIINHGYFKNSCAVTDFNGDKVTSFDSVMSMQHINALNDYLANSPRFQVLKVYSVPRNIKETSNKLLLTLADSLCRHEKADGAIILNTSINKNYFLGEQDNARLKLKIATSAKSNWIIFNQETKKIVDIYSLKDSSNFFLQNLFSEEMPNMWNQFYIAGYRLGEQYGKRIAQAWVSESRYLCTFTNADFTNALQHAKKNEWGQAIQLWEMYANCNDKKYAAAATFNIAVACEANDDLGNALNWAAKSYFIQNHPETETYISSLEKRVKDKDLVIRQLSQK